MLVKIKPIKHVTLSSREENIKVENSFGNFFHMRYRYGTYLDDF